MSTAHSIRWFGEPEDDVSWRWWLERNDARTAAHEIPVDTDVDDLDPVDRIMLAAHLRGTGKKMVFACHECGGGTACGCVTDMPRMWWVVKEESEAA
ncbi:MAG TPA: hypothetical protein VFB66_05445 [Tepidisphaeraceae bacterium]|nr:hypothetical protein [Tepidisphaeraceae bacterium]